MKMKLLVEEEEEYDSYVWKTEKKKKIQKNFAHTSDEQTHKVAAYSTKTTDGLSLRQFTQKKVLNVTTARVSGQLANIFITKPQLVYTSVGVEDQITSRGTGPTDQWERSVGQRSEALRPAGQLGAKDRDRD